VQTLAIIIAIVLSISMTYLTLVIIDNLVGVNISIEAEHHGIDKIELGYILGNLREYCLCNGAK
jgi:ammonia channel protein AmtB